MYDVLCVVSVPSRPPSSAWTWCISPPHCEVPSAARCRSWSRGQGSWWSPANHKKVEGYKTNSTLQLLHKYRNALKTCDQNWNNQEMLLPMCHMWPFLYLYLSGRLFICINYLGNSEKISLALLWKTWCTVYWCISAYLPLMFSRFSLTPTHAHTHTDRRESVSSSPRGTCPWLPWSFLPSARWWLCENAVRWSCPLYARSPAEVKNRGETAHAEETG